MKKLLYLLCMVFVVGDVFGQDQMGPYPWTAIVKVVDESRQPIEGANISVGYALTVFEAQAKGKDYDEIAGLTDAAGGFTASHSDSTWDIGIDIHKTGYYNTHTVYALLKPYQADAKAVTASRNLKTTLLLKKIGRPIAMYAKQIDYIKFPEPNKPIGYDFMIGDWAAPYGKGINADIFFEKIPIGERANDVGSRIVVTFPNKNDGIQVFNPSEEEKGSALRSPHEAPLDGYQSEWIREPKDYNENRIYLFRVKTKTDDNGNIVSARYGKIYGDFMQFKYYLNPTPNDRNIEFDPKQNLIHGLQSFEQVSAP